MYFRNYRPWKKRLDKCLKTRVWEDLSTGDMVNGAKHWFNLNESAFIINTVTACDKYSLISRDKWMQTSQMYLFQKQNVFSEFFSAFFESALNFKNFQKKMTLIAYVFPKLPTTKDVLR